MAVRLLAAASVLMTAGLGVAELGAATTAQAQPGPFPDYYWCPGQFWDPGWGENWDWDDRHDDHYLYRDGEPIIDEPYLGKP